MKKLFPIFAFLFLQTFAFASDSAFTRKMLELEATVRAIHSNAPLLETAESGVSITSEVLADPSHFAPQMMRSRPKLLVSFKEDFEDLHRTFIELKKALALSDSDKTKADQIKTALEGIDAAAKTAHDNFIPFIDGPHPQVGPLHPDPIDFNRDERPESELTSGNPGRSHRLIWGKNDFIKNVLHGKIPDPTEFAEVVVVGGGMSGLLSAYFLRNYKPILLEQSEHLGGNSKAEVYQGTLYSIGAAYITDPDETPKIKKLLRKLGLKDKMVLHESSSDPVYIRGVKYENVWESGTTPDSKAQFNLLYSHFQDMIEGRNGLAYPEIPPLTKKQREYINKLDVFSMKQYLESVTKAPLHPDVEFIIDRYLWSAMGGTINEVSAASGLNFFLETFGKIAILPGGNAGIAQALFEKTRAVSSENNFRTKSIVFDVKADKDGVNVAYMDAADNIHVIRAKKVIVATPKFATKYLIDDLEPKRSEEMGKLTHRSYLVANVILNKKLNRDFYDVYFEGKDSGPRSAEDFKAAGKLPGTADIVYGNFACDSCDHTVLTFYRGLPLDGVRTDILKAPYQEFRDQFEAEVKNTVLPLLGVDPSHIAQIRVTRWGHHLPLAHVGFIAQGGPEAVRMPFKEHVVFVNQDNWALPDFETVFHEADEWSQYVSRALRNQNCDAEALLLP